MALTTLAHHIDISWLHEAFQRTRKDGAPGVDRQTAEEYATNLEDNLRSLLDRAKSGMILRRFGGHGDYAAALSCLNLNSNSTGLT